LPRQEKQVKKTPFKTKNVIPKWPLLAANGWPHAPANSHRLHRELLPSFYNKKDAKNLHDPDAAYHVMYRHILHGSSYPTLVGAFNPTQLNALSSMLGIQVARRGEIMR
jgi:hypothetical protein